MKGCKKRKVVIGDNKMFKYLTVAMLGDLCCTNTPFPFPANYDYFYSNNNNCIPNWKLFGILESSPQQHSICCKIQCPVHDNLKVPKARTGATQVRNHLPASCFKSQFFT